MKRIIFLFVLFTLYSTLIYSQQSIEVVYKATLYEVAPDTLAKKLLGEDNFNVLNRMTSESLKRKAEILKDFEYRLKANRNESLYTWEEEIPDETVPSHFFELAINVGGGRSLHYQNKSENIYLYQFKDLNGKWQREYGPLFKKWEITRVTDTILGYKVIKAVFTKKLNTQSPNPLVKTVYTEIAWFTPQLTLPFGPAGTGGLPGLILKYQTGNRVIYATKIKLLKKDIRIKKPEKGKLISIEEATAKRIKKLNNLIQD